ncbi:MAG: hypothetical protein HY538_05060, partial [Deltaproteobacteria bacterium]|nr:hypothetical protein [Deltaproteobacteria bacterium]
DEILDTLENTIDDVTDLLDDGDEEDGSVIEHIDEILDTLENTIDDVTDLLDDGDDSDEGGVQIPDEVSDVIQDLLDDLIQVPEEGTGDDGIQIPDEVRDAIQKRLEDLVIVVEPGEEPEESPSIEEVAGDLAGALIDLLQAGGYFPFAIDLDSPTAVAVDPATGNVWVSVSSGVTGYQDLLRIENNGAKTTFLLSLRGVDNLDFDIEGNLLISAYNCIKKASIAEDDDLTISDVICLSDDDSITVNGIGVTPSNEIIFAATNKRIYGKIYGIDPSGVTRTLVEDLPFTPMDLTVDRTGRVFLTTDGTPTLMEVLQEGSVQTVLQGDAHTPSAVGLNLDGSLLVNDFVPLGDYRIIKTDGDVWMEGLDLVDMGGISSDPTGKYVAILDHGTGSVYRRTTSN